MKKIVHGAKNWFALCPGRHWTLLIGIAVMGCCRVIYHSRAAANFVTDHITAPVEHFLARLCAAVPFSVAEICWAAVILGVLFGIARAVVLFVQGDDRPLVCYRTLIGLLATAAAIYAGFCLLWGVNYYADDFSAQSGLAAGPVTAQQLAVATAYFAQQVNDTADGIARDETGCAVLDTTTLLKESRGLYTAVLQEYPFLTGPDVAPKGVFFSGLLSRVNFTGFYFPFTGEANINTDFPDALRPFTIAHEMAHQRNIAAEQEANFVGIRAAVTSGLPAYEYSGYLAGYLYLANALYNADNEAWVALSDSLCDGAKADLAANNSYWAAYQKTVVSTTVSGVYDGFLKSYDQTLGRKSYGACVDLLCAYYAPET